ncbi:MAG: isopeptide-forming domain-containing fimbrial protein [Atopobiaceae bacterium]|nr:isopeptide-forming domain-containing fimbrial protein [Atopobiaceae bacterium]
MKDRRTQKWRVPLLLFTVLVTALGVFALSGISRSAVADEVNGIKTWDQLREAVEGASGDCRITLDPDATIVYDGTTIEIPAGKNITIVGSNTIYRDKSATTLDSMFTVKGELTIGDKVKLSGKTATCPSGPLAVTKQYRDYLTEVKDQFKNHEFDRVVLGFSGVDDNGRWVSKISGDSVVVTSEGNVLVKQGDGTFKFKDGVNPDDYGFVVTNPDNDQYGAAYLVASNGKSIGRPTGAHFDPVKLISPTDTGYLKVQFDDTWINMKFLMGGGDDVIEKFIFPYNSANAKHFVEGNPIVIGSNLRKDNQLGNGMSHYFVQEAYWTVEGIDREFDSEQAANEAAAAAEGSGIGCTPDTQCGDPISAEQFSGKAQAEKGYFAQVDGGTLNITGNAELSGFVTANNVSYAAPVVVKGGTFNMDGGSIKGNSVGYHADNSMYNKPAHSIGKEDESGNFSYMGAMHDWTKTETAGGVILTEGSTGSITGGSIAGNRGDTGGVLVQGSSNADDNTKKDDVSVSKLHFTGGAIDSNFGVHHGGGMTVYNGAAVEMGEENGENDAVRIKDNFSWHKGGGVFVSEEVFASMNGNDPSNARVVASGATFILRSGTIDSNVAVHRGGGIEVASNHVSLYGGAITNNNSRTLGGGIYVEGDAGRMYQLYVDTGCITKNHAHNATNLAAASRGPQESDDCNFSNELRSTEGSGDLGYVGGFWGDQGNGGGVWLCPLGGNATFALGEGNTSVIVAGNTKDQEGKDVFITKPRGGVGNGLNVIDLGTGNDFVTEDTGSAIDPKTSYSGKLGLVNTTQGCSADGGVFISGNSAVDGGGIAANGTVIFGRAADTYRASADFELEKTWAENRNEEPVTLKFFADFGNGERAELGEVELDGTADTPNEGTEWYESEAWKAKIGLPLAVVTDQGNTKGLFTVTVGNESYDPSKDEDLRAIYAATVNDSSAASLNDWNLVVEEYVNNEKQTFVIPADGAVTLTATESAPEKGQPVTYTDIDGNEIATVGTYSVNFNFSQKIVNEGTEKPEVEKYVNKDVHSDIVNFDQEFTYDIMAYVPAGATEFTISDTLVEALEFADAEGNATTDPLKAIQSIVVKADNDHKASVKDGAVVETIDVAYQEPTINGQTLTVTIVKEAPLAKVQGKWVQVTFNARIKDQFRDLDTLKAKGWATKTDNKQGEPMPEADSSGSEDAAITELDYVKSTIEATRLFVYNGANGPYVVKIGDTYYSSSDLSTWKVADHDPQNIIARDFNETFAYIVVDTNDITGYEGLPFDQAAYDAYVAERTADPAEDSDAPMANWPVKSDESHEGIKNQAEYTVKFGNDSTSTHKTNTVTVKPETTQLQVEKKWNDAGSSMWPEGTTVTFGVFAQKDGAEEAVMVDANGKVVSKDAKGGYPEGAKALTVKLNSDKAIDMVKDLPLLKGVTYVAREIKINDVDVKYNDAKTSGVATVDGTDYVVSILKTTAKVDEEDVDKFVATNETPQVEKYVENVVHAELETFDEPFEFSVMGFVPEGATKVVLTDTLTAQLDFVDANPAKVLSQVIVYKDNDHKVNGTVSSAGIRNAEAVRTNTRTGCPVTVSEDGKTVTLELDEAFLNDVRGNELEDETNKSFWVKMSFKAVINQDAYDAVAEKIASGDDATDTGLNWEKVVDNGSVVDGDAEHAGLLNKASYKVYVGNEGTSDHDTNTVTVEPKTTKVEATKTWLDENSAVADWPTDVQSVTVNVFASNSEEPVDTLTITKGENNKATTETSKELPKLENVTYSAVEVAIPGYTEVGEPVVETDDATGITTYTFTNKKDVEPGEPEIEKYVNKNVHSNIALDEVFTYDVLAYVTKDADKVTITDTLNTDLQFVGTSADVDVVDLGTTVDHMPNGSVAGEGTGVEGGEVSIDGQVLTVTIANKLEAAQAPAEGVVNAADEQYVTPLRGHWVKVTFQAKIADGKTIDDLQFAKVEKNAPVISDETHEGVPNTASYEIEVGNEGKYEDESNTVTVKPEEPQIEKYINKDVDAHLVEFDKTFTYDIMAYVTNDADKVEIMDTLVNSLEFVSAETDVKVAAQATNDHEANGTVATEGTAVEGADVTINGQTLTVTIADATAYRGQWIQVTFDAKYTQAAINAAQVADSQDVSDNGSVISDIATHDGTANTASYTIEVGNDWKYTSESNTVTHDAETVKVSATKQWKNADGTDAQWPAGVSEVKVNVLNGTRTVDTITLTAAAPSGTSKELPKLSGVTYRLAEVQVPGYISRIDGNVVVNTEGEGPEVEKYVNNDVTYDFDNFDQVFEYEIMGYVTNDATAAEFTDTLNSVLEFAGDGNVKVFAMGTTNDHETTVAGAGTEVTTGFTASAANGQLSVAFDEAGITPLRGQWVKVTFNAQISEAGRQAVVAKLAEKASSGTAVDDSNWANISDNGLVLIDTTHDGIPNEAQLTMSTQNNGDFELETNTVTVEPTTIQLEATKQWMNAADQSIEWPAGAKVTFALMNGNTLIETKTLSAAGTVTFTAQPRLSNVIYTVVEMSVEGIDALQDGDATVNGNTWSFTNRLQPDTPEIEKFVNKAVHKDIQLDEVFTYDVLAYITNDADAAVITDVLDSQLQFVSDSSTVSVVDLGENVDHKPFNDINNTPIPGNANVSVTQSGLDVVCDVEIGGPNNDTLTVEINDATDYRGHWVKVTFEAKIKDGLTLDDLSYTAINVNDPVLSNETHDGVPNTASYQIKVGNDFRYEDLSNTVTVKPEEPKEVVVSKVEFGTNTPEVAGAQITVTSDNGFVETWTSSTEPHTLRLQPGTYTLQEVNAPEGFLAVETTINFTVAEDGTVTVTNAEEVTGGRVTVHDVNHLILEDRPIPTVEVSKVDAVDTSSELAGATLVIRDANGTEVERWVSTDEVRRVQLQPGTYTLEEITAPFGYAVAESIEFTVTEDGVEGGRVTMEDRHFTTNVNLEAQKVFNGGEISEGQFSVTLSGHGVEQTVANDAAGKFTFAPITLTLPGEYTFMVSEVMGSDASVSYDTTPKAIRVTTVVRNNRLEVANIDYNGADSLVITNTKLQPGETQAIIEATKYLTGDKQLEAGEFSFQLAEGDTIIATAPNGADGKVIFPAITYTEAGTHTYTVTEIPGNQIGYTYDARSYDVTVTVALDEATNQLAAYVSSPEGGVGFTNTYVGPKEITISKTDLGGTELDGATITVRSEDGSFGETWVSTTKAHTLKLRPGRYVMQEVVAPEGFQQVTTDMIFVVDEQGKVTLETVEVNGGGRVVVDENNPAHLLLEDAPNPTIYISKTDLGANEIAGAVIRVTDSTGKTVDSWTSTTEAHELTLKPGRYTMVEVVSPAGFQQVTTEMIFVVDEQGKVTLETTEVNGGGALVVTDENRHILLEDAPGFTDVILHATKQLDGQAPEEGRFTFNLLDVDGNIIQTVTNAADGSVTFEALRFTQAGTYTYFVEEEWADNTAVGDGIAYDGHTAEVQVIVEAVSGTTGFKATLVADDDVLAFENLTDNHPEGKTVATPVSLTVKKTLDGVPATRADQFKFQLVGVSDNAKDMRFEATNDSAGNVSFANITFTQPGLYQFELSEIAGDDAGITYDTSVYKVFIRVFKQGTVGPNSRLMAEIWVADNKNVEVDLDKLTFANTTPEEPEEPTNPEKPTTPENPTTPTPSNTPTANNTTTGSTAYNTAVRTASTATARTATAKTGDATNFALMGGLAVGGVLIIAAVLKLRKSNEE